MSRNPYVINANSYQEYIKTTEDIKHYCKNNNWIYQACHSFPGGYMIQYWDKSQLKICFVKEPKYLRYLKKKGL
jgi:endo-alpha-1,4-polygalactosaminidase (GH114 family)